MKSLVCIEFIDCAVLMVGNEICSKTNLYICLGCIFDLVSGCLETYYPTNSFLSC